MKLRLAISFFLGSLFMFLLAYEFMHWYLGGSTSVSLENRSGLLLEAVTISGSGFKASLGEVRPNEKVRARIYPAGESSLRVAFRSNGRDVSVPLDTYFEGGGGYILDITVDPKLSSSVAVDYFSIRSHVLP